MASRISTPLIIDESKIFVHQMEIPELADPSIHDHQDNSVRELRFRLSSLLQTTLDLEHLLKIYFTELQQILNFQGLRFRHNARKLNIIIGKASAHRCNYRLTTSQGFFGEVGFYRQGEKFKESELALLESTLDLFIYPLRNALTYHDAVTHSLTDPLTGVGNRLAMENALKHKMESARRYRQALALLMLDLDRFKQINDTYGHPVGDDVLRVSARTILQCIRNSDLCFRYGGEEFVVVLTQTGLADALCVAERIRSAIEHSTMHEQIKHPVTTSIGLACFNPHHSLESLIKQADEALYQAKQNGRNQVQVFNIQRQPMQHSTVS